MAINTGPTVCATLSAVEHLKKPNGNLVFVSRVASIEPGDRSYAYCMSKVSMSIFAKRLMNVTALQNRVGFGEEIASTIAFLMSDEASFVNGHEMFVDGGYMLKLSRNLLGGAKDNSVQD